MDQQKVLPEVLGLGDLSSSIAGTYHALRVVIVLVSLWLPIHLVVLGPLFWDVSVKDSLSDYYGDGGASGELRDWFVGYLFGAALLLVVYRGFRWSENWALNFGGACLLIVALVPKESSSWHTIAAVGFFAAGAYVAMFEAQTTLKLVRSEVRKLVYQIAYPALSLTMIAAIGAALLMSRALGVNALLVLEWGGVWAFGLYWCVKTIELLETDADAKVMRGEVSRVPQRHSWRNPGFSRLSEEEH